MPNPFKKLFKGKDKSEVEPGSAGQATQDSEKPDNNPLNGEVESVDTQSPTTTTQPLSKANIHPNQTSSTSVHPTDTNKDAAGTTKPQTPPSPNQKKASTQTPSADIASGKQTTSAVSPLPTTASGAIDRTKRSGIDVLTRLTARSNQAMMAGVSKAKELNAQYIDTEHALWGLLSDSGIYQLISDLKVTPSQIQSDVEEVLKKGKFQAKPQFSPRTKRALELSLSVARSLGYEFISPEHILLALAQEGEGQASKILAKHGLTVEVLNKKITGKEKVDKEAGEKRSQSAIDRFAIDLTQMAKEGKLDPVVARSAEIERIMHILSRRTKNNPVLIGEAGVGKTAIVEGLAQRIASGNVPETLQGKRILSVDLMSIIAGASHRGEFEQRLKNFIREVKAAGGEIILFIDEIHNMVGAGAGKSSGGMDASNILKPSLARGELQTIGATTITEYRKHMEKDRALERRFQPVMVEEPTTEQAIEMLTALRDKYEAFHKVSIPDESIKAAVYLSHRYIGDRFLPDKAVDLIDEAASSVRLPAISLPEEIKSLEDRKNRWLDEKKEAQKTLDDVRISSIDRRLEKIAIELKEKRSAYEFKKSTTTNQVTPEIIQEIVSRWTNIPISKLTESESNKLLKLEDLLHKQIIDQRHAVDAVAEAVRRGRAGLKSAKRPIGSFIFMGPTGVGKTELAKVLAATLFGAEEKMVRLDMTEYMERHEVAKLIGAPPGYVGYEEGGQLTEAVRRQPYSVILLDEIEKAHADVFNILLQILDDGRLTDNKGRTIDFKNTILIATSNIGTNLIQKEMVTKIDFVFDSRAISTLVYSPTGRAITTLNKRMWKKEKNDKSWTTLPLKDYFKGQDLEGANILELKQKFPVGGFDSHVISPSGEELVTAGGRIWRRKSTTAKTWRSSSLIDYFKNQEVTNAKADRPEQQLPTAKIDTVAISPSETQIVTYQERFWMRNNLTSPRWQTGTLKDYLEGCHVQTAPTEPPLNLRADVKSSTSGLIESIGKQKETENTEGGNVAAQEAMPNDQANQKQGDETAITKGVSPQIAASMAPQSQTQPQKPILPQSGGHRKSLSGAAEPDPELQKKVKELMEETDQKSEVGDHKSEKSENQTTQQVSESEKQQVGKLDTPEEQKTATQGQSAAKTRDLYDGNRSALKEEDDSAQAELEQTAKISKKSKHQLPTDRWDIHLFTPAGEEIIIKNKRYWKRAKFDSKLWTTGTVREFFPTTHVKNADINNPEHQLPVGQEVDKARKAKEAIKEAKFAQLKEKLLDSLREFFRPELLNRFDDIIVFKPLSPSDLLKIVDLQFNDLAKLLEEQNIGLEVTDETKQEIAIEGYDPIFGARPLRRTIQKMIENPISSMIIKGDLKPGDVITVDFDGNDFIFIAKLHPSRVKDARVKGLMPSDEVKSLALSEAAYNFRCSDCKKTFTSEVVEHASILCPNCASHNVNVVAPQEPSPKAAKDKKQDSAEVQRKTATQSVEATHESPAEKAGGPPNKTGDKELVSKEQSTVSALIEKPQSPKPPIQLSSPTSQQAAPSPQQTPWS